jgi:hypothetical protein
MLWIAVQCHRLALDCALRAHEGDAPLAVCDRLQVLQASDAAWALGLRPGMRRATALSLAAVQAFAHVFGRAPANIAMPASLATRGYEPLVPERNLVGDWVVAPLQRVPPPGAR